MSHLLEFSPHHPNYDLTKSPSFSSCYKLAHSVVCPIEGHRPPLITLGRFESKICAICEGTEVTTTFDNDAHTLPAAFGNRHHFSNEECDQCNLQYGREYENHLALWLNPERTMHRVRRRPSEPPPTLKGPNGTSVGVDGVTGALKLNFDSQQIDQIHKSENREILISYIRPACNQVSALRSLFKTAWLLLTPEERARHPLLIKLIKKETSLPRWEYWDLTPPGNGYASVQFEVWSKLENCSENVAPLIIRFIVGNTILLWIEPDEVTGVQAPSPFPPVRARVENEERQSVSAKLMEITKDAIFPEKEEAITFTYGTLTKGGSLPPRSPPKPAQKKISLQLTHEVKDQISIKTVCHIRAVDEHNIKLFMAGDELAASIIIKSNSLNDKSSATITLALEDYSVEIALKTLQFFKSLREHPGKIILRSEEGTILYTIDELGDKNQIPAPPIEHILRDILIVNQEFDLNIKYNRNASDEDLNDLSVLSRAIQHSGVSTDKFGGTLTFNTNKDKALEVITMTEGVGPSEFKLVNSIIYDLWGTQLPVLERTLILPSASLKIPIEQLKSDFANLSRESIVAVPFTDKTITFEFPRWKKSLQQLI